MVEFSNLGLLENQSIIKVNVSAIQVVTDNLPNSGALTDIAQVANQSVIIANQSTILDSFSVDATASNQSAIIVNQTSISDDVDLVIANTSSILDTVGADATLVNQSLILIDGDYIIANTSTIIDNISSGEIGDATLSNQSLILTDGDYTLANQTTIIANQSTILDTIGGDATLNNQSTIIQYNQTIDNIVDGIKTITDALPDSGTLTSIASIANQSTILDAIGSDATLANQSLILVDSDNIKTNTSSLIQTNTTIDAVVDGIKTITDALPDAGALTSLGTAANQSLILADADLIITNTSSILNNISSGEIGDASLANQSSILIDGDLAISNTTTLLQNNATIDTVVDGIKAVTDLLPDAGALTSIASIANQSISIQYNASIDYVVDTIQAVTDLLPDSGALSSLGTVANQSLILTDGDNLLANTTSLIISNSTIDIVIDGIKSVTDVLPDSGTLTSIAQVLNQSIIIANQSTILDTISVDATAANQTAIIANQTLISNDIDLTITNTSSLIQTNSTIDSVVDTIQVVTDAIPDSGAMTSIGSINNQSLTLTDGDNLIANTSSLIQTNATIDNIVDTILTNTSTLLSNTTEVSGYYNLSTASGPHTVFTISISERKRLASLFLDLINLSYASNIKIDHKIDGTNYRTIVNTSWAITDDNGMYFNKDLAFTHDVRLTMSNGTSANATVPYYYILENVE